MICGAVHKVQIGNRWLSMHCTHARGHPGDHWDRKRSYTWAETIYWDEFERTKSGMTPLAARVQFCRTCGMTDCGCWAMAETATGQTSMFQKNRLEGEYERTINYFDEFFQARCNEMYEDYFGEW